MEKSHTADTSALLNSPEFQQVIDDRAAAHAQAAVWADKPDFIPNYESATKAHLSEHQDVNDLAHLTDDDERFLNRPQLGREDVQSPKRTPNMDMDMFMSSPEPEATEARPYLAILRDLKAEKSMTAQRHWTTKAGHVSKATKEVPAVSQDAVDSLLDEVAVNLMVAHPDRPEETTEQANDRRMDTLFATQEKGDLSDDEMVEILDRMVAHQEELVTVANTTDEILQTHLLPALAEKIDADTDPMTYFRDEEGYASDAFRQLDAQLSAELNKLDNPVVRAAALKEVNTQLKHALDSAKADYQQNQEAKEAASEADSEVVEGQSDVNKNEAYEAADNYINTKEQYAQVNSDLTKSRQKLAKLSIQLRGKHSQKRNQELQTAFNEALIEYGADYKTAARLSVELLEEGEGKSLEDIQLAAEYGAVIEHEAFTNAELEAYEELHPKVGRVAKGWSKLGLIKKSLFGFGSSAAVTTVATGVVAATGVGAVIAGGALLSVKAARSVGMYKLNKNASVIKSFNGRASEDGSSVASDVRHAKIASAQELSKLVSESVFDVIDGRVEKDQKNNRKSMYTVVGASALGTVAGSFVGDWLHSRGSGNSAGQILPTTPSPIETTLTSEPSAPTTASEVDTSTPTTDMNSEPTTTAEVAPTTRETTPPSTISPEASVPVPSDVTPPDSTDVPQPDDNPLPDESVPLPEDSPADTPTVDTDTPADNAVDGETSPPEAEPVASDVLEVPSGKGFEDSIQAQYGLTDAQSHEAFKAMEPYLLDHPGTYIENGDIRIAAPGSFQLNPQATVALDHFLHDLQDNNQWELPKTN